MMTNETIFFFDTWAKTKKGTILHFEVVTPFMDPDVALMYARSWLESACPEGTEIRAQNLTLCHQMAPPPTELIALMGERGWGIIGLEGCQNLTDCIRHPKLT